MSRRSVPLSVLVFTLLNLLLRSSVLADGTQFGTVAGVVRDESGAALPGATVAVTNTEKGITRSVVTDAAGKFVVPLLLPGPYRVAVSLQGFETSVAEDSVVAVDKITELKVTLKLSRQTEAVTVRGDVPIVDKTNAAVSTQVQSSLAQKLPIGRTYQALYLSVPGVVLPGGANANPNFHGALLTDNLYLFDGIDTTDPTTGGFGQNFTYEAIQEVLVTTSAASADFGRATGGIINVITKSGSNQLSGSGKIIAVNDQWDAQNKGSNPVPRPDGTRVPFARDKFDKVIPTYSLTLGGPFWRDHAWFFGAYEWSNQTSAQRQTVDPRFPQNFQSEPQNRFYDAKGSWQMTPSHLVTAKANSSPTNNIAIDRHNGLIAAIPRFAADLGALNIQDQKSRARSLQYSGILGSSLSAEAGIADANTHIDFRPFVADRPVHQDTRNGLYYNGPSIVGFLERTRTQGNLALNYYTTLGGNSHNAKLGFDYQKLGSTVKQRFGGNQLFLDRSYDIQTGSFEPFQRRDYDDPAESASRGTNYALYALDRFSVGSFSLNLGLRYERQTGDSDLGTRVVDTKTVAPRIAGTFDLRGDGKTLALFSYGRYYQDILQSFDDRFAGVPQKTNYNLFTWDSGSQRYVFASRVQFGGNSTRVDTGLTPTFLDEFTLGFQRQIGSSFGIGLRGIYRKWHDLIDDVIGFNADGSGPVRTFVDYAPANRRYRALELTLQKRFASDWGAQFSYTLSRTNGNQFLSYESELGNYLNQTCTNTVDRTIGNNGSLPCSVVEDGPNKDGLAPFDRTHVLRAYLAYHLPIRLANIILSPVLTYQTGDTYQKQRILSVLAPNGTAGPTATYYYEPAGSQRVPSIYQLDFAAEATYPLWKTVEIGLKGEIFNLTNQQKQIQANLVTWCDADTTACATARSQFGLANSRNAYQTPRNYRVTALVRF